jgi:hypothetical protein
MDVILQAQTALSREPWSLEPVEVLENEFLHELGVQMRVVRNELVVPVELVDIDLQEWRQNPANYVNITLRSSSFTMRRTDV